ncbi:MAG: hypothetical protein WAP35_06935, partial [Solirubrobacterales bacterium]
MEQFTASNPKTVAPAAVFERSRPRYGELVIRAGLVAAALLTVATTVGIVLALATETFAFFQEVGLSEFLFGTEWTPLFNPPSYGVLPLVAGTLQITLIGLIVAIPLGVGSAIYLGEYAHPRTRKIVKPILELLAGVPTVVFGFFALATVT